MKEILIGRDLNCDIVVEPAYTWVSGRHAVMYVNANGEIIFKDISKNGSTVNGTPIRNAEVKVAPNSQILLGGNYPLVWQKVQPLLYRGMQNNADTYQGTDMSARSPFQPSPMGQPGQMGGPMGQVGPIPGQMGGHMPPQGAQMGGQMGYGGQMPAQMGGQMSGAQGLMGQMPVNGGTSMQGAPMQQSSMGDNATRPISQMADNIDLNQKDEIFLSSFNWGCFFLMPWWGFGNGCWWAFLLAPFFPITNIIMGIFATRMAWKNKRWDNFYQFKTVQQTWSKVGIIGFIFSIAIIFLVFFLFFGVLGSLVAGLSNY